MAELTYEVDGPAAVAIQRFVAVWSDGYLHDDIGPKLTCREAESLAGILGVFAGEEMAESLLDSHAEGDTDPEDDHYREAN